MFMSITNIMYDRSKYILENTADIIGGTKTVFWGSKSDNPAAVPERDKYINAIN